MWKFADDHTRPVITAQENIFNAHHAGELTLPQTAVMFFLHGGIEFMQENFHTVILTEEFPRFLGPCPIYQVKEHNQLCFLEGGTAAPQAVDTLETLHALGVRNVIAIGLFGAFGMDIQSGDIIIPRKALVEEGTSLHYYEEIEQSEPDKELFMQAARTIKGACQGVIVSTDAIYRQTFYKESMWRRKGAVGVDMETSALYSVGKYLGMRVVSILIGSDQHPKSEVAPRWQWSLTKTARYEFFWRCMEFALKV